MKAEQIEQKKQVVQYFLDKNLLVSYDLLEALENSEQSERLYKLLNAKAKGQEALLLNKDISSLLERFDHLDLNWQDMERLRVLFEKELNKEAYLQFLKLQEERKSDTKPSGVEVVYSYEDFNKKREVQDFVAFFTHRYEKLRSILLNRQELQSATSISRLQHMAGKETVAIIGMVIGNHETKNKNIILTLEDTTGETKVLISKNKAELCNRAKDFVMDEVIGVVGVTGNNIVFANTVFHPDIPASKELVKAPDEAYCVFISDLHVGSKLFLHEEFDKFLRWMNQETGNQKQREVASKVQYVIIAGDLVAGAGIYPGQEQELALPDIKDQYAETARLLAKIPKHVNIIICPGNHDAMRLEEPQPQLYKDFAQPLWDLPNVTMLSNPAMVRIHSSKDFPGLLVLLYHGVSFDYLIANVDSIRNNGGYDRADLVMKFLLQRRHLAPSHQSTRYIPDTREDALVINKVPDIFVTGHIHKAAVANYRNVTMICSSCWESISDYQEKLGHKPEPARVPLINLQTREVKMLRF